MFDNTYPLGVYDVPFMYNGLNVLSRTRGIICTAASPQLANYIAYALNQQYAPKAPMPPIYIGVREKG